MLTLLLALCALLVVTRFYPKVTRLEVTGASHYSGPEVLALAKLDVGDPLLWVTKWQVEGLLDDPWIRGARVVRYWPHRVSVTVEERTPALVEGATVYALDGTVLPDVSRKERAELVTLKGWGPDRRDEALELLRLLAEFRPEVISYSPSGFTVHFAESSLYTPDIAPLRAHWSGFLAQRERSVAVYPWGVSVQP